MRSKSREERQREIEEKAEEERTEEVQRGREWTRARKEAGRERDLRSGSVTLPLSHFLRLLPTPVQKKGARSLRPSSKQSDSIQRMKTFLLELVANEATKCQAMKRLLLCCFVRQLGNGLCSGIALARVRHLVLSLFLAPCSCMPVCPSLSPLCIPLFLYLCGWRLNRSKWTDLMLLVLLRVRVLCLCASL